MHRATSRPAVPAADFFVEWRIRQAPAGAGQAQVFTSRSAATGGSGFGAGAVVVGTAQGAGGSGAQGVRVANGQAGLLALDRPEVRTVYDLAWTDSRDESYTVTGMHGRPADRAGGTATALVGEASPYERLVALAERELALVTAFEPSRIGELVALQQSRTTRVPALPARPVLDRTG